MPRVSVTSPKKLKSTRIIKFSEYQKMLKKRQAREEALRLKELAELEPEEEIQEEEPEQRTDLLPEPVYFSEYKINNFDKPLEIEIPEIPEDTIPISEVREKVQEAYDQGFADGQQTTSVTLKEQIAKLEKWLRRIDSVIENMMTDYSKSVSDFSTSVGKVAVMAAEKILDSEISSNRESVINQIRKAIAVLDDEEIFSIRLNPDDIEIMNQFESKIFKDPEKFGKIKLIADDSVDTGGCILQTSSGEIDARIGLQLKKLGKKLKELSERQVKIASEKLSEDFLKSEDEETDESDDQN